MQSEKDADNIAAVALLSKGFSNILKQCTQPARRAIVNSLIVDILRETEPDERQVVAAMLIDYAMQILADEAARQDNSPRR